jgi:hypothetical protein
VGDVPDDEFTAGVMSSPPGEDVTVALADVDPLLLAWAEEVDEDLAEAEEEAEDEAEDDAEEEAEEEAEDEAADDAAGADGEFVQVGFAVSPALL